VIVVLARFKQVVHFHARGIPQKQGRPAQDQQALQNIHGPKIGIAFAQKWLLQ
jgi:hypothetical protein